MHAFITGIAGFLGSHLAKRLLDEGWEVSGNDIIPRNDAHRLEGLHLNYYRWQSLLDMRFDVQDLPNCTHVIHCAAVADVPFALRSPQYALTQNVLGTVNLLETLAHHTHRTVDIDKVVIMSTESVYAGTKTVALTESALIAPTNIYGVSKAAAELAAMAYFHSYNLPVTVIRSSTLYGPGGRRNQVIPLFIQAALDNTPLTVQGDGRQSRDFNFVSNLADGIILALTSAHSVGEVFNIASGQEVSIIDLARKVTAIHGGGIINYSKPRPGEGSIRLAPSIAKAETVLKYHPKVSFDEGLRRTYEWHASIAAQQ